MLFGQLFITDKRNNLACPLKSYQRAERASEARDSASMCW